MSLFSILKSSFCFNFEVNRFYLFSPLEVLTRFCVCVCVRACAGGHYVELDTGKVRYGEGRGVMEGLREELSQGRKERQEKSQAPSGLPEVRAQTVL